MLIGEVLFVVCDAPLCVDRATAADDAGQTVGGVGNEREQHSGMDGEVVHPLLSLLDESVAKYFPRQILSNPANLVKTCQHSVQFSSELCHRGEHALKKLGGTKYYAR